jgi:hypothetical protein
MVGPRMTKTKPVPAEAPKWTGPNGEVWEPPPPNSPPVAKPGWLTKLQMDAVNAKPIPAAAFEVERWQRRGGGAGLSVNGVLLSGRKPK